jgi:hypothetical protein
MISHGAYLWFALQAPAAPEAATPTPAPVAAPLEAGARYGVSLPPPGYDPHFAAFLAHEQAFARRLSEVTREDLRREWADYEDDERDKAADRIRDAAEGEVDEDKAPWTFDAYMEHKYKRTRNIGVALFGVGFAPLGIGLYIGTTLGEGGDVALGFAGFGGAVILAGAVVWAVRGARLSRYRRDRDFVRGRPAARRVEWRGLGLAF